MMFELKIGDRITKFKKDEIVFLGLVPGCQYTYFIGATSLDEDPIKELLDNHNIELCHIGLKDHLDIIIGPNYVKYVIEFYSQNSEVVYYGICGQYTLKILSPKTLNQIIIDLEYDF